MAAASVTTLAGILLAACGGTSPGTTTSTSRASTKTTGSTRTTGTTTTTMPADTVTGHQAPSGVGSLLSVSCPTSTRCIAVGSSRSGGGVVITSTDGGRHWSGERPPADTSGLTSVSCWSTDACLAAGPGTGSAPVIVATSDGGQAWRKMPAPAGASTLVGLQCQPGRCTSISVQSTGYVSITSTDGGTTWTNGGALPSSMSEVTGLSCGASGTCLASGFTTSAVDQGVAALASTTDGGSSWAAPSLPAGSGPATAAGCDSSGSCILVADLSTQTGDVSRSPVRALVSSDGGGTWAEAAGAPDLDQGNGIDCPARGTCVVVGTLWSTGSSVSPGGGVSFSLDGGRSWRSKPLLYVGEGLASVSCPDAQTCIAVGGTTTLQVPLTSTSS